MGSDWQETTLGDLSSDVSYGYTESASSEKVGPRFLRITDIQNGVVDWRTVPYCPITEKNYEKYKLHQGDIVVARTGNSTGENCLFNSDEDAVYASYLIRFKIDDTRADSRFVWYTMRSANWWNYVNSSKTGSAQAGANAKVLGGYPVNLPPLPEQRAIAHILGSLDDKIELNRRMNETLEGMAQALFKSWFIDFDPVIDNAILAGSPIPDQFARRAEQRRAILAQNQPSPPAPLPEVEGRDHCGGEGLPNSIRQLFPSEFECPSPTGRGGGEGAAGIGWIPKGWEVKIAEEIADISIGKTPPRKEKHWFSNVKANNVIWVSIKDMGNCSVFIRDSNEYLTMEAVTRFNVKQVPRNSVLVSFKLTVGRVVIAQSDLTTNEAIAHFVNPKFGLTKEYLFCYLTQFDYGSLGSTSSIATAVNSKIIKQISTIVPPAQLSKVFSDSMAGCFDGLNANADQMNVLSKLRDTLLPKLLSGEIRISDAEKMMEEAI